MSAYRIADLLDEPPMSKRFAAVGLAYLRGFLLWISRAVVLCVLWNWFVVDLYESPSLSFRNALGIILMISALLVTPSWDKDESVKSNLMWTIVRPFSFLALGATLVLLT